MNGNCCHASQAYSRSWKQLCLVWGRAQGLAPEAMLERQIHARALSFSALDSELRGGCGSASPLLHDRHRRCWHSALQTSAAENLCNSLTPHGAATPPAGQSRTPLGQATEVIWSIPGGALAPAGHQGMASHQHRQLLETRVQGLIAITGVPDLCPLVPAPCLQPHPLPGCHGGKGNKAPACGPFPLLSHYGRGSELAGQSGVVGPFPKAAPGGITFNPFSMALLQPALLLNCSH